MKVDKKQKSARKSTSANPKRKEMEVIAEEIKYEVPVSKKVEIIEQKKDSVQAPKEPVPVINKPKVEIRKHKSKPRWNERTTSWKSADFDSV